MVTAPTLADVTAAHERIRRSVVRTPALRLPVDAQPDFELFVKLENMQPIGSFKLRGASNAMALAEPQQLARGVLTASAGNMAQGVAWCARERGVPCTVIVPEQAPRTKTDAVERLGGTIVRAPFERWWQTMIDRAFPGVDGEFVHPFADRNVMAGNGTIALELLEDLQHVDAVLVPFGGGGLACGIAAALRDASSHTRVYAVEVETAAPLAAAFEAGEPVTVEYQRSFVDGIGSARVTDEMWPLAEDLLHGALVVSLEQVASAVKYLAERAHIVAEGAGASSVAAAMMDGAFDGQRVVAIVSGGNIDTHRLTAALEGAIPE